MNTLSKTKSRQPGGSSYHCCVLAGSLHFPSCEMGTCTSQRSMRAFSGYHAVMIISFLEVMLTGEGSPEWHNVVMIDSPEHARPFPAALSQAGQA